MKHGMVDCSIGPIPEHPVSILVQAQKSLCVHDWLPDPLGERLSAHPILNCEDTGFELFSFSHVAFFCCMGRDSFGLFGELQVRITR